jgi:hypothetical protein
MKNKKFDDFYKIYIAAKSEAEEYALLNNFMMSCSIEELMAWNQYLTDKSAQFWAKNSQTKLKESEHQALAAHFEKIDALTTLINKPTRSTFSK